MNSTSAIEADRRGADRAPPRRHLLPVSTGRGAAPPPSADRPFDDVGARLFLNVEHHRPLAGVSNRRPGVLEPSTVATSASSTGVPRCAWRDHHPAEPGGVGIVGADRSRLRRDLRRARPSSPPDWRAPRSPSWRSASESPWAASRSRSALHQSAGRTPLARHPADAEISESRCAIISVSARSVFRRSAALPSRSAPVNTIGVRPPD